MIGQVTKMNELTLKNYLRDLGRALVEDARSAKASRDAASDADSLGFENGRLIGYNEAISTVKNQAIAFGLTAADVGLEGVDPDRDFI